MVLNARLALVDNLPVIELWSGRGGIAFRIPHNAPSTAKTIAAHHMNILFCASKEAQYCLPALTLT